MKFKKVLLITLMLLAILTVGAVSASDDVASDVLAVEETGDDVSSVNDVEEITDADGQEDAVGDGEKTDLSFIEVCNKDEDGEVIPGNYYGGAHLGLYYMQGTNTTGPVTGNVSISIDGKEYYNGIAEAGDSYSDGQVNLDELYKTGNLTFGTHTAVLKFFGDDLYNDYTVETQFNLTYFKLDLVESYVSPEEWAWLRIYLMEGANGTFNVSLDGDIVATQYIDEDDEYRFMDVRFDDFDYGEHTYTIDYEGSCPAFSKSYSFTSSYITVQVQGGYAGNPVQAIVQLPIDTTGNVTVTYRGKEYEIEPDNQVMARVAVWNTDEYSLGENEITFSYQDDNYPLVEVTKTFTVEPVIRVNGQYGYNSGEAAIFGMSPDATGKFVIYLDNKNNKIGEAELIDGRGSFTFEDISVGKYTLIISYEGDDVYKLDDYINTNFRIVPNVIIPKAVNVNEEYYVTVFVNPDIQGHFTVAANPSEGIDLNTTWIPEEGVPSGIIQIPLQLQPDNYTIYVRYWRDDESERFYETNAPLSVKDTDRHWEPVLEIGDNINLSDYFEYDYYQINITNVLQDGTGVLTLSINGNEIRRMSIYQYIQLNGFPLDLPQLNEGINYWTLSYSDDDYYDDWQYNGTITASGELKQSIIMDDITQEVLMKDDWQYDTLFMMYIYEYISGGMEILIDGNIAEQIYLEKLDYIDDGYREAIINFNQLNVGDWSAGQHECTVRIYASIPFSPMSYEVIFSDSFSFTLYEQQKVENENVTIEIIPTQTILSDDDILVVITANDITSNVVIYVDDSQTPVTLPLADCRYDQDVDCYIIGSKELGLDAGTHKLKVSYPGEGTDALSLTGNVILVTSSLALEDVTFDYGESGVVNYTAEHGSVDLANITLIDANGNVVSTAEIEIDGDKIIISNLDAGTYTLRVILTPEEYYPSITAEATVTVNKLNTQITAAAKAYVINYGGTYSITLKDANGNAISGKKVTFTLNGKNIGTATTNAKGVASIKLTAKILKAAKAGKRNLVIKFAGDDNYNAVSKTVKITVNKEKTKIVAKKKTFKRSLKVKKYAITLKNSKGKAVKKVQVTLKIKGKTFKAKTNARGKAIFKIKKLTKKGTYKAKINFKTTPLYLKSAKTVKIKLR